MTIEKGNKLIANFHLPNAKKEIKEGIIVGDWYIKACIAAKDWKHLQYDSSWNWLMPVIEKIEKMGYIVEIYQSAISIKLMGLRGIPVYEMMQVSDSRIKAVWLGIIEFIKWYNEGKKRNMENNV